MTGRRADYTIFSVDIGVTDVTRNSRPFAVTSTTCSTLSTKFVVVTAVFSPPIDIKQALQSSTPSQCLRADSSSYRQKKALNSHKLRDRHIYASQIQDTRYINTRYTLACGVCGLFSWSMAAGLLAFSSRQFALTIKHGPSLCPLHTIFPS